MKLPGLVCGSDPGIFSGIFWYHKPFLLTSLASNLDTMQGRREDERTFVTRRDEWARHSGMTHVSNGGRPFFEPFSQPHRTSFPINLPPTSGPFPLINRGGQLLEPSCYPPFPPGYVEMPPAIPPFSAPRSFPMPPQPALHSGDQRAMPTPQAMQNMAPANFGMPGVLPPTFRPPFGEPWRHFQDGCRERVTADSHNINQRESDARGLDRATNEDHGHMAESSRRIVDGGVDAGTLPGRERWDWKDPPKKDMTPREHFPRPAQFNELRSGHPARVQPGPWGRSHAWGPEAWARQANWDDQRPPVFENFHDRGGQRDNYRQQDRSGGFDEQRIGDWDADRNHPYGKGMWDRNRETQRLRSAREWQQEKEKRERERTRARLLTQIDEEIKRGDPIAAASAVGDAWKCTSDIPQKILIR